MNLRRHRQKPSIENLGRPGLDDMDIQDLEQVLVDLLIIKYPGVDEDDIVRLFEALRAGAMDQVGQIEADMAHKSARWRQAVLDAEQ
jgi:hypothetical protein